MPKEQIIQLIDRQTNQTESSKKKTYKWLVIRMFNIINYKGKSNQNSTKLHHIPSQNSNHQDNKQKMLVRIGARAGRQEPTYTVDWNVN
jgi:hypothetical protein